MTNLLTSAGTLLTTSVAGSTVEKRGVGTVRLGKGFARQLMERRRVMLRRIKEALFLLALVWAAAAAAQNAEDLRFSRANPCVLRVSSKGHVTGNPESKEMRRDGRQYAIYLVECVWNGKEEANIQVEMIPMISGGKDTSPRYSITNSLAVSPGRTSSIRFFCPKNPPKNGYNPNVEKFRKVRGVVVRLLRNGRIFKIFCSSGAWQRNAWEPVFPGLHSPGKRLFVDDGADENDAPEEEPPTKKPELAEPKPVQSPILKRSPPVMCA